MESPRKFIKDCTCGKSITEKEAKAMGSDDMGLDHYYCQHCHSNFTIKTEIPKLTPVVSAIRKINLTLMPRVALQEIISASEFTATVWQDQVPGWVCKALWLDEDCEECQEIEIRGEFEVETDDEFPYIVAKNEVDLYFGKRHVAVPLNLFDIPNLNDALTSMAEDDGMIEEFCR